MAERLLTFRSGGWVLLLSGLLSVLSILYVSCQQRHPGDGEHVESYGFDLSTVVVPRAQIVASGFSKDTLPAMVDPEMMSVAEAEKAMESEHSTLLKPLDRVIGVVIHGDARAYPPAVLMAHEVVNDTVGGVPVVVSFNPLCDSAVVLGRTLDGKVLTFGVSGLLLDSCVLMYDRQSDPKDESLWSPLQFKAISGKAAAHMLPVIPCELVTWQDWKGRHPDTKVVKPQGKEKPEFGLYFSTDDLKFPVAPTWDAKVLANKTPVVAIHANGRWHVLAPSRLAALDLAAREKALHAIEGVTLIFNPAGNTLRAESALADFQIAYSFVFAWYAQHERDCVLEP